MAYLGNGPLLGAYTHVDDISSSFDGSAVTFNITKNSISKTPVRAENFLVSIDGVFQEPYESYSVLGSTVTFTEAPAAGSSFFGIILGNVLNIGAIPDGSVTIDKMTNGSVDTLKIVDDAITTAKIVDSNITTLKIADSNITTDKVADGAITLVKLDSGVQSAITASSLPTSGGTLTGDLSLGTNDITAIGDITSSGNYTTTGNVTAFKFNATSDATLKADLQLLDNPLDKISQLNGYSFKWKTDQSKGVGIVAQEVEAIFPELVETGADGYKRVNYDALVPVLIEAVKELSNKIKEIK